jgi:hypothetical protein
LTFNCMSTPVMAMIISYKQKNPHGLKVK